MGVGYSLSGFVALSLGLAQDVYHSSSLNFSTEIYFVIITIIIIILSVMFIIYEYITIPKGPQSNTGYMVLNSSIQSPSIDSMVLQSSNDLLMPEGMDDIFITPLELIKEANESS